YIERFRRRFGRAVKVDEAAWEIFRRFPEIPSEQMNGFYDELEASDFLGTRPIYPEAVEAVRRLAADGHRLFVVTGRLTQHRDHTRRLLQRAGVVDLFEELVHRENETSAEYKPRIVRELRLDLLIEDELHVALAAAQVPIPVLLFDRPWNQAELPPGMTRVSSWDEVRCLVAALAAARLD
ncbi:MAG TPA: HAD family hydrolase, partial [Candidatus Acidoferrum sp.]|nr:HAD family hydrolase [Candidatus Acidoferrum sp.]